MSEKKIEYEVTANPAGFEAGMKRVHAAMAESAEKMKAHGESMTAVFEKVRTTFALMAGVMAGGKAFKESIDTTVKMTTEAVKMGKTLGITATEASILNVALNDIHASGDQVTMASSKITKTLSSNEGAFKSLGVATREQDGHFRNSLDIMLETNTALLKFREGTDRNIEGAKIYGKSWGEVAPLLKLNTELMEESKKKAEALGVVIGQENVEATMRYRNAMNDANDVFEAVEKTIGDAVMPVLSELAEDMSEQGPAAVQIMRVAMAGLIVTFDALRMGLDVVWVAIKTAIQYVTISVLSSCDVINRAMHGDFKGAKDAWVAGFQQIRDVAKANFDGLVTDAQKAKDGMLAAISNAIDPKITAAAKPKGGDKASTGGADSSDGGAHTKEWESQLTAAKVAYQQQHNLREMSKAEEVAWWQTILEKHATSEKEKVAISQKMSQLRLEILKGNFDKEVEGLKAQQGAYQYNMAAKLALAQKESDLIRQRYGEDSKEYEAAQAQIIQIKRKAADQVSQIEQVHRDTQRQASLAELNERQAQARFEVEMGVMTQTQELAMERQFTQERYAIDAAALDEKLALAALDPDMNPVLLEQIEEQKAEIRAKYNAQMVANSRATAQQISAPITSIMNSVSQGMTTVLTKMATGWKGLGQTIKQVATQIGTAIIQETIIKPLVAKAAAWIKERALTMAGIGADAVKAGTGAASAEASIPYVGPILAIAAMAAVMAAVMGSASKVPSAEGGYDIPAGLNPLTQLHEQEMVLPKGPSNLMRRLSAMEESGQLGGGGQGGGDVHYHDYSGRLTHDEIRKNARLIATELSKVHKDGWRPKA